MEENAAKLPDASLNQAAVPKKAILEKKDLTYIISHHIIIQIIFKEKNMRKVAWRVLLSLFIAAAFLGACKKESTGGTTLNLWHIQTQEGSKIAIDEAAKRFEAANPGVKVVVSVYENDPYKTKIKTVSGDEFPDVFHSWGGGWLQSFVDAGLVEDITDVSKAWADEVSADALRFNSFNGKIYGSPYVNTSTPLYYNKSLFEKYGLEFPTTWEEMEQVCDTFIKNGVIPFALGNRSKWPGAQHFVYLSMRLGGPDIFQRAIEKKTAFTDPAFIEAGNMLIAMVNKGWFPDGVNGINYDTGGSRMMFYTEQCAMIVQTSGFITSCKSENPDFYADKLAIGLYPAIGSNGKNTDLLAGENAFSVSSSSKNKEMAVKLVAFMSTDPQFQQEMAEAGRLPARLGVQAVDVHSASVQQQIEDASYMQNFIDQTLSPALAEVHKDTVQALFGGTMTSLQAAEEMQRSFNAEQ
jgi:raffinose/stachyose/melibiose transport system substrate-binding protein